MWKWIVAVVVILIVVGALLWWDMNQTIPVGLTTVGKGQVDQYVDERAKTSLHHTARVTMPFAGRITAARLKQLEAGTQVKRGQVVAEMDLTALKTELAEAQAVVKTLESQIAVNQFNAIENTAMTEAKKFITTMQQLVSAAQRRADASKQTRAYYQEIYERKKKLYQENAATAEQEMEAGMLFRRSLEDELSDQFVARAVVTFQTITELGPVYIQEWLKRKKLVGESLQHELSAAKALQSKLEHDLKLATMTSPITGRVLKRYVDNQRVLQAGAPLLDIGNLDGLEVTANILSEQVVQVAVGDPVEIRIDVLGPTPLRGKVKRIKPEAFTKVSSLGVEEQRVPVIISIDPEDLTQRFKARQLQLGVGYRVQVRVITDTAKQVLRVPRTALFRGDRGQWQVYKIDGDQLQRVDVEVGLSNDLFAEVTGGLRAGDQVVTCPDASMHVGMKVRAAKR